MEILTLEEMLEREQQDKDLWITEMAGVFVLMSKKTGKPIAYTEDKKNEDTTRKGKEIQK